jgi:hypothetical protein
VRCQFGEVRSGRMSESSDNSLSWEYFNMEKVVCDECEVYVDD